MTATWKVLPTGCGSGRGDEGERDGLEYLAAVHPVVVGGDTGGALRGGGPLGGGGGRPGGDGAGSEEFGPDWESWPIIAEAAAAAEVP